MLIGLLLSTLAAGACSTYGAPQIEANQSIRNIVPAFPWPTEEQTLAMKEARKLYPVLNSWWVLIIKHGLKIDAAKEVLEPTQEPTPEPEPTPFAGPIAPVPVTPPAASDSTSVN